MVKKRGKVGKKINSNVVKQDSKKKGNFTDKKKYSYSISRVIRRFKPKTSYQKNEARELLRIQKAVIALQERKHQKHLKNKIPLWFYIASIFAAFLFVVYISTFATLHFESIEYMNITIVFLFIAMVSFYLISAIYFISEKKHTHAIAPILFFIGIVAIMVYAFKAVDTTNLVRFSIIYAILVAAISSYVLAVKRKE